MSTHLNPNPNLDASPDTAAMPLPPRGPGGARRFEPKNRFGPVGVGAMVGAHALLGYLLVSGLARDAIDIVKKPLEATIVQEVKLPPPPPPPPPPPKVEKVVQEVPKVAPPPPAYVPPPEITPPPAAIAAPTITAVQTTQPVAPPPAAPPPPPPPAPEPAPPPPAPPAAPQKADIAVACPKQVAPEMPDKAVDDGISGTVRAELRIKGGKVVGVQILSGPRVFHAAVRAAVTRYGCSTGDAEVTAVQEFAFKVD